MATLVDEGTRAEDEGARAEAGAPTLEAPLEGGDALDLPTVARSSYALGGERGRGGRGRVLEARDRRLGRSVALKEPLGAQEVVADARFVREAMVTARLQHPSIVPVYEAGRWPDGTPFYAMKLVSGEPMSDTIAATSTLAERLALLPNMVAVADAMAYAHGQGVIHRDLKPGNVLLGPYGETVVADWGLAKDLRSPEDETNGNPLSLPNLARTDMTATGAVLGTPAYMAPEQARGEAADERADVYALGAMLYHVLAGEPPRRGESAETSWSLIAHAAVTPLVERTPAVPPDLAAIVARAMSADPRQRYPSAREFAADLRRYQTGQLVGVYQYGWLALLRRWLNRHRAAVAVAGASLAIVAAIASASAMRIVQERNRAERRAAELTLAHARAALASDPTAALAWLANYPERAGDLRPAQIAADARSRGAARHVLRAGREVARVAVSPDGTAIAAASDGFVVVWDACSGRETLRVPVNAATQVVFAPDGAELAVGTGAGEVAVIALPTGNKTVVGRHPLWVIDLAYAPGGEVVVSAWEGGAVRSWDRRYGNERELGAVSIAALTVGFSSTGEVVAVGIDGDARAWRLDTGASRVISTGRENVAWAAVTPSGDELVIANGEGLARVALGTGEVRELGHGPAVGAALAPTGAIAALRDDGEIHWWSRAGDFIRLPGHDAAVIDMVFSPDGRLLASLDERGEARVWDQRGEVVDLRGHQERARTAAFGPDGKFLVTGSQDGSVRVWQRPAHPVRMRADAGDVYQLAYAADGAHIVTTSQDGGVRIWDPRGGQTQLLGRHASRAYALALSPDLRTVVSSAWDGSVIAWDRDSGQGRALGNLSKAWSLAISPDGAWLASSGQGGAYVVRLADGAEVWRSAEVGDARTLAWSPDSTRLAVGSWDRRVYLLDRDSARLRAIGAHDGQVSRVRFLGGGALLATASFDGELRVWDTETGTHRAFRGHTDMIRALAVSPDERWIATGSADDTIRMWELRTGTSRVWRGHSAEVRDLAFSPDGAWLASGSLDASVRVWHVDSGRSLPLYGHQGRIHRVAWSPDGRTLASSSQDGSVGLWRVRTDDLAPLRPGALRSWLAARSSAAIGPATPLSTPVAGTTPPRPSAGASCWAAR